VREFKIFVFEVSFDLKKIFFSRAWSKPCVTVPNPQIRQA
jgi:hypothetical protein